MKIRPMDQLRKKVVVITGASSGFGKGAARRFAKAGAQLVLAARRERLLNELADECNATGGRAIAVPTDVSKIREVQALAQKAVNEYGRIDVWVNDAGVGALGMFDQVPLADHIQVIETNLLGTIYGSYFALTQFRAQESGVLINIASALGKIPAPYYSSYAASKYGVVGLGAAIRQELRENKIEGIHVCTVMPMAMDTPFFDHAANYTGHAAAPIPPLYDPKRVVDIIIDLAIDPADEVIVGAAGKVANVAHQIAPGAMRTFMSRQTQKSQIEQAPLAPFSAGALHEPIAAGAEVRGGRRME
jgi:short-subunit dehydrogenase